MIAFAIIRHLPRGYRSARDVSLAIEANQISLRIWQDRFAWLQTNGISWRPGRVATPPGISTFVVFENDGAATQFLLRFNCPEHLFASEAELSDMVLE